MGSILFGSVARRNTFKFKPWLPTKSKLKGSETLLVDISGKMWAKFNNFVHWRHVPMNHSIVKRIVAIFSIGMLQGPHKCCFGILDRRT